MASKRLSVDSSEVTVQDDARESKMAKMLGLERTGDRNGFDAFDRHKNNFELKSTSNRSVTTGRDVGRAFLNKWRAGYFIVANTQSGSGKSWEPKDFYFLHPDDLEGWIASIEKRLEEDENLRDKVLRLSSSELSEKEKEIVEYVFNRGMTLNNPKIPWDYIEKHGTKIKRTRLKSHLAELVSSRPLRTPKVKVDSPKKARRPRIS